MSTFITGIGSMLGVGSPSNENIEVERKSTFITGIGSMLGIGSPSNEDIVVERNHIPENGNAVIVYGPHVGFSNDGIVGKVERKGIKDPNGCCGSAIAAMNSICSEHKTCHLTPTKSRLGRGIMGKKNKSNSPTSVSETQPPLIDIQQYHVCQQIKTTVDMSSADRISLKSLPAVNLTHESLPTAVFDAITPDVDYLLGTSSPQPSLLSKAKTLVVVGGILINTASEHEDYFLPLRFQLFNEKYEEQLDLLGELNSFGTDNESN
ncbi:hypothetical protein TrLO_g13412 [Triparma laevis f. longispina]|uniref:Limiting CO2-inducible protein B/C beta carbonyic anhydrase domain-containing protein n=1 Tax=Triparma laevis f. longispina TaxID=1714387 RepID=A0A9W7KZP3_9STRA|nr:hypothetical protein TrLO_g13412 [Triparma laevis f. longispina]